MLQKGFCHFFFFHVSPISHFQIVQVLSASGFSKAEMKWVLLPLAVHSVCVERTDRQQTGETELCASHTKCREQSCVPHTQRVENRAVCLTCKGQRTELCASHAKGREQSCVPHTQRVWRTAICLAHKEYGEQSYMPRTQSMENRAICLTHKMQRIELICCTESVPHTQCTEKMG